MHPSDVLKTKISLNYILNYSSYLRGNRAYMHGKYQPVNISHEKKTGLYSKNYTKHANTMRMENSVSQS